MAEKTALAKKIQQVIKDEDSRGAGKMMDFCRFTMGMTYNQILERVQQECPEVTPSFWDALLYDYEQTESRGY